jgi:hypothetical protein
LDDGYFVRWMVVVSQSSLLGGGLRGSGAAKSRPVAKSKKQGPRHASNYNQPTHLPDALEGVVKDGEARAVHEVHAVQEVDVVADAGLGARPQSKERQVRDGSPKTSKQGHREPRRKWVGWEQQRTWIISRTSSALQPTGFSTITCCRGGIEDYETKDERAEQLLGNRSIDRAGSISPPTRRMID